MARTTRSTTKSSPAVDPALVAAIVAALSAQGEAPQEKAATTTPPKEEKIPFLSCWTASRIKADPKGQFSHTDKRGVSRDYVALSEADAVKAVKANYRAGRTYAIPA